MSDPLVVTGIDISSAPATIRTRQTGTVEVTVRFFVSDYKRAVLVHNADVWAKADVDDFETELKYSLFSICEECDDSNCMTVEPGSTATGKTCTLTSFNRENGASTTLVLYGSDDLFAVAERFSTLRQAVNRFRAAVTPYY